MLSAAIALAALPALPAFSAPVDCLPMQQPLVKTPEIVSSGGRLTVCKEQAVSCIKTVAPFEATAFSLKTNEISKPVHTQFGWHVIQAVGPVNPPKKATTIPFDQVKAAIKQQQLQQKKQDAYNKWWNATKSEFAKKTKYQVGYEPPASATQTTTTG